MATYISVGETNAEADADDDSGSRPPSPAENGDAGKKPKKAGFSALIGEAQAGVVELSSLITNPGLKRAESSEVLNLTLHQCARDGNDDILKRLLQSLSGNVKKKVNAHDDEDLSALHYAARYNHFNTCRILIEYGANPNDVDNESGTPLHFAARYKRMRLRTQTEDGDEVLMPESTVENSVILLLVDRGCNVNARDIYGQSPLHFAAMRGNEVATKELLSCGGINVEAVDKQQMTALHMAASHNEVEVCRMLIEAGANVRCCDEEEATPLLYACMEGSVAIVEMLFEAAGKQDDWVTVSRMLADQDNQQNTPLHLAVENRSYEVAKICIEKGADVNATRSNYSTPLHLAAVAGDVQIVELVLDHQARVDALDITQSTPLHKAAAFNHVGVVEFLLERGAKIDKHDKDNFSPMLLAACNGHAETIKTLLSRGANLYHTDKNDKTAIYWAAEEDKIEALQVLLEHPRARELIDTSDRYDNTPLHVAAQNGYLNAVKCLLEHEADMDAKNEEEQTPLHLAAKQGKTHVVRELVRRNKMVINDEDEDSNTALHLAALAGHNKAVQALIDAGADIEARNCNLWTPLDCSAAKGWAKTCRVLLEADAPIDPMDKTKTTPLHLASRHGHVPCVSLLLKWHANVSQLDTEGFNCLDMAIENGHKDVAMVIVNSNKWQEALSNETIDIHTLKRDTPMRKLIRKMPDVAEKVFNNCTNSQNHSESPNYEITFLYEFLDDTYACWGDRESDATSNAGTASDSIYDEDNNLVEGARPYTRDSTVLKMNHPLSIMVKCNQEDLLAHPLVTSLLRHKWKSFGRYVYYANLSFYTIFLLFLTGYVVTTPAPSSFFNDTLRLDPNLMTCTQVQTLTNPPPVQHVFAGIAKYAVMAMAAINILRELFQIYNSKLNYFGWENLIEWITYVFSFLLVLDLSDCQRETGVRLYWQWQLGSLAIFLAWIDLVLFFRKFPRFGIYVVMFTDICYTFIQFFPVFLLFIIAFALSFYMLASNQTEFTTPGWSILKTSVMMIGEFEYADLFLGMEGLDQLSPDGHKNRLYNDIMMYILFVTFLILMTIIIMNLLVGLAVDDIKAVQEQAVLKRLAMQVELALDVEAVLPQFLRRKFLIRSKTVYPNAYNNVIKRCLHWDSSFMSSAAIQKALNPDLDEMEVLQENQDKMMKSISNMRGRIKGLENGNEKLESMLGALLRHHNVDWQEEDASNELGTV